MPSAVSICNLALSHLGDAATVTSIDPPEGSAQAEHCAMFYPMALNGLLEMHDWGFATRRAALTQLATNPSSSWAYAYATPSDMMNPLAVLAADASDDNSQGMATVNAYSGLQTIVGGIYTPQPYSLESAADGTDVLLTNTASAVLRYISFATDPSKFSPLFVLTLAGSLASMLAGPVIKGDAGLSAAARWQMLTFGRDGKSGLFGQAVSSDANQKRTTTRDRQQTPWLVGR